jgi:hypothetical protein
MPHPRNFSSKPEFWTRSRSFRNILTPFAQGPGVVEADVSGYPYHEGQWPLNTTADKACIDGTTAPGKKAFKSRFLS